MSGVYADDGTTKLYLGDYGVARADHALESGANVSAVYRYVRAFQSGMNTQMIQVETHDTRANRGDVEKYGAELLRGLAIMSDPITIGVEDGAGNHVVYGGCRFIGGETRALAHTEALAHLRFRRSALAAASDEPAFDSLASKPSEYPGTATGYRFEANAVECGSWAALSCAVQRPYREIRIPRCDGVRFVNDASGAEFTLSLDCRHQVVANRAGKEEYLRDLQYGIGTGPVTVTGNGNTWSDCYLQGITPAADPHWGVMAFTMTFTWNSPHA